MTHHLAHMEAAANTVIGVVVSQAVLFSFGIAMREAAALTGIIILLSYVRSFLLRLVFRGFERRIGIGAHIPHGSL